MEIMKLDT